MQEKRVVPQPGMVITEDTVFAPGVYEFPSGQGITIAASGITVDGSGAVLLGPGTQEQGTESFQGTGIYSRDQSGVVLKNVTVRGFNNGLIVENGRNWTITGNDFSDNFTDPDFGWGDGPQYGGVLLIATHNSLLKNNKGRNNWNGLDLRYSNDNRVENNDFSHASNVCLRMWNASRNVIADSNFSYGLRISPGEVHARDSSSLLVESGSNDNEFYRNDFSHGGDGIFIRVLNGWISTGNYFEENDCSYANNNAVEAWSPGNTYVRNIANYSSYGFWLGGSDNTVLIGNQVRYNGGYKGLSPANAPEAFGNAGIAVVNGPGSHFVLRENDIQYNNGPGLAIRYKEDYPSYHWIIEKNTIANNCNDDRGYKGYGIYMKNARWLDIAGNDMAGNEAGAIYIDANVIAVSLREASREDKAPQVAASISDTRVAEGTEIVLDASSSSDPQGRPLSFRWELGDGTIETEPVVRHSYDKPGFYRVGLTVDNGRMAELAFFNVYVHDGSEGPATEEAVNDWTVDSDDPNIALKEEVDDVILGARALRVEALTGKEHILKYPANGDLGLELSPEKTLIFWLKYHHETYAEESNRRPIIRLCEDGENYFEFRPQVKYFLERIWVPVNETKGGWLRIEIPLAGNDVWERDTAGSPDWSRVKYLTINYGPSASARSTFIIDGLQFR